MADFDVRSLNPGDKLDCASSFGYFYLTEVVSKTDSAITVEMKVCLGSTCTCRSCDSIFTFQSPSGPLVETIPFTSSSRFAALGTHTSKVRYDLPPAEESDAPAPASAVVPPPGAPVESVSQIYVDINMIVVRVKHVT